MSTNQSTQQSLANAVSATLKKSTSGLKSNDGFSFSSILSAIDKKWEFQLSHVESLDSTIKSKISSLKHAIVLSTVDIIKSNETSSHQGLCKESELHSWSAHQLRAPLRLRNTGNSCYLNAVLQCVLATAPLIGFCELKHKEPDKCPLSSKGRLCYLCEVGRLVKAQKISNQTVCPSKFLNNIKSVMRSLSYDSQEDAHEYFLGILSKMEQNVLVGHEHLALKVKDTNPIRSIFGGITRSQVVCQSCHKVSCRDEQMFNLSLDITKSQTIKECLENYTRIEHLKGANAYKCESCSALKHAKRHVTIHDPPKILTIQFNRFSRFHKIDSNVQYPIQFDLRPYMSRKSGPSVLYRLYATVNHKGASCRSGHYIAYTRRNNHWQCLDDDEIHTVGPNEVLRSHPYLLYYERIDAPVATSAKAPSNNVNASSKVPLYPIFNGHSSPSKLNVSNGNVTINAHNKSAIEENVSRSLLQKKKQASIIQGDVGRDIRPLFEQKQLTITTEAGNSTFQDIENNQNSTPDAVLNHMNGDTRTSQWTDNYSPPDIIVQKRNGLPIKRHESEPQNDDCVMASKRIRIEESSVPAAPHPIAANVSPPICKSSHFSHNNNYSSNSRTNFNHSDAYSQRGNQMGYHNNNNNNGMRHQRSNWHNKTSHNQNFNHYQNHQDNRRWFSNNRRNKRAQKSGYASYNNNFRSGKHNGYK